jgi:putative flippase GtrA
MIIRKNLFNPFQAINPRSGFGLCDFFQLLCAAMRRHIHNARDLILPVIDLFYPPFKKIMPLQTFRYAVCGGTNALLGLVLYFIFFKYILKEQDLDLGFYAFKSHQAALFLSFCINFPFGFFLMKYVVFSNSNVKGKIQLVRYFSLYVFTLILNYLLLKVFVENFHIYPVTAQVITAAIVITISYLTQRHFTFRIKDAEKDLID